MVYIYYTTTVIIKQHPRSIDRDIILSLLRQIMTLIKQEIEEPVLVMGQSPGCAPCTRADESLSQLTETCQTGLMNMHADASELLSQLEGLVSEVCVGMDLMKAQFLQRMDG